MRNERVNCFGGIEWEKAASCRVCFDANGDPISQGIFKPKDSIYKRKCETQNQDCYCTYVWLVHINSEMFIKCWKFKKSSHQSKRIKNVALNLENANLVIS